MEDNFHIESLTESTIQYHASDSDRMVILANEPFLQYRDKELTFQDKSTLFYSLVALVKANYPFNETLQDRAFWFLKSLKPEWGDEDFSSKLVLGLVPSPPGLSSDFAENTLILLSSPHLLVVESTLYLFLQVDIPASHVLRLVESDFIPHVFGTVQPHRLPIFGNEAIFNNLNGIIEHFISLASPSYLKALDITTPIDIFNHRELVFQKVVIPSSPYLLFLCHNRQFLDDYLSSSFMLLQFTLFRIGPFHAPTSEYILASPIMMTLSNCLMFAELSPSFLYALSQMKYFLEKWKEEGPEVTKTVKRMMEALFSEGFEDTLEQMKRNNKDGQYGFTVAYYCHSISQLLGSNVELLE